MCITDRRDMCITDRRDICSFGIFLLKHFIEAGYPRKSSRVTSVHFSSVTSLIQSISELQSFPEP